MSQSSFNLSSLNGSNGFAINGIDAFDRSGYSVSGAGDINGDGIDDLIINAPFSNPEGENYVVFGSSSSFGSSFINLSTLNGSNGFVLNGGDGAEGGRSVSSAGDVNGDGIDDLIIGNRQGDGVSGSNSYAGESYVVFGSSNGFNSSLNLSALNGSNGFFINGVDSSDESGHSVSGAGDVNGDGIDDIIIGAYRADPNGNSSGESYVVFGNSSGFGSSLNLSDLNGSNGFVINGIDAADFSGYSVSNAGDVNGDGIDDLIIGAFGANPNSNSNLSGESYVVFGSSSGFGSSLNLSDLDGSNGFILNGINADDRSGISVSNAGDVNGDGIDDLIIGAHYADPNGYESGESYVIFGSSSGFGSSLNLSDLDGSNGFVINGIGLSDNSGRSVSSAGDVNGDGIDDLIIGAPGADPSGNNAGESYVVFGSSSVFGSSLNLSDLDGSNGFVINGINAGDESGRSVSDAGDVNGDGIDDIIIGARSAGPNGNNNAGESYVVYGNAAPELDLNSITGAVGGFTLNGADGAEGRSAGDVNGDGIDDLIIGSRRADPNGNNNAGASYVVFGNSTGFDSSLNLSDLNGSNGFILNGINAYDNAGTSVSSAGDVNGDGIDDLIIGAPSADPNGNDRAGESYVVFGNSTGFDSSLNLSDLNGSNGFVLNGIGDFDYSGTSVSNAGDVNGDGIDDIIIGAYRADPNGSSSGESYVVFGNSNGFGSSLNLSDLNGSNGFVINGIDNFDNSGRSVSNAGDVNGDGIDDLIIGAYRADPNGNTEGESYVVFGNSTGFGSSLNLSDLNGSNGFVINGIDAGDESGISVSNAGDVNGDGIDDLIIGAHYADPNGNRDAGESYVVFGNSNGFGSSLNLSDLNGSNGFVINGIDNFDYSGVSVSSAGDVNDDGIDDLIIGAHYADPNGNRDAGESYVVFGNSNGFGSSLNLSDLDGSNGFVINGIDEFDNSGEEVSNAGDVNGDGIDDLIISASGSRERYVVFGHVNIGASGTLDLSKLAGSNSNEFDGIDFEATFTGDPILIVDSDLGLSDANSSTLAGATITITNLADGMAETLSATTDGTSIMATYTNGVLTLSGTDTVANYQQVLRTITYSNSNPSGTERTFEFIVDDGEAHSNTSAVATTTLSLGAPPIAADDAITVNEEMAFNGNLLADNGNGVDSDPNGDTLTVTAINGNLSNVNTQITLASGALLTLNDDGTFSYDPNGQFAHLAAGETDTDSFTYTISDGNGGTDTATVELTISGVNGVYRRGTPGADQIVGSVGDDTLEGLTGNDSLHGGNGNDSLNGGDGADLLTGGSGNDLLIGGNHNDTLNGHIGQDTLYGGSGNDQLNGGFGADLLSGGFGHDLLIGGDQNDTLNGSFGSDTLYGGSGDDRLDGGDGTDSLAGGLGHDLLIGGNHDDTLEGYFGRDTLFGGSGNDVLNGSDGTDLLSGGFGNDLLIGGNHNDTLTGSDGQDTLVGGNGNDVLVGGIANDRLIGGTGADRFQFAGIASQLGVDTIVDFGTADVLQLSRSTFGLTGAIGSQIDASEFATVGSVAEAQGSGALITYNSNNGSLYFNANGAATGFGTGGQFAQLSNTFNLTATDIELIA